MGHLLVGWAYTGQMEMYPRAPFGRHPRRSRGYRIPRRRRDYARPNSHLERRGSIPRASHLASGRRVAADRCGKAPRSRKRTRTRPQHGVLASDISHCFGTTPCGSPRLGLFSTSARFQAEPSRSDVRCSTSFALPAGTKCGPRRHVGKQYYERTNTRAGPASVETTGLAERLQFGLESDDAGHNPLT